VKAVPLRADSAALLQPGSGQISKVRENAIDLRRLEESAVQIIERRTACRQFVAPHGVGMNHQAGVVGLCGQG
jgi:hypothetical protein